MNPQDTPSAGFKVGGLLYMPALQENIADKIINKKIPCLTSVAFCLEDAIRDEAVEYAEEKLQDTLQKIAAVNAADLPLMFIRVRSAAQIGKLHRSSAYVRKLITGYILPKFDTENAAGYLNIINAINKDRRVYMMPILESRAVADIRTRRAELVALRDMLDERRDTVLNVRVGVNDLCGLYGLKCPIDSPVYDIGALRDILADIINVFAADYVVSAPVRNYFGKEGEAGLKRELALDKINGFIGKTAVHPSQLPLIYDSLRVTREEYEDATAILNWQDSRRGVAKNSAKSGMNEVNCHWRWARRVKILADIYGVKD